jgi:hypothetical protein
VSVLAELIAADGTKWQARRSPDRGRLQVVAVISPSAEPTIVELLNEPELRALLAEGQQAQAAPWICVECGTTNDRDRRWCRVCSEHVA